MSQPAANALNKIMDRLPKARFQHFSRAGMCRIIVDEQYYIVRYFNSFVVVPQEKLACHIFETMPENAESKAIENLLNGIKTVDIGQKAIEAARITSEDLAFVINCTPNSRQREL